MRFEDDSRKLVERSEQATRAAFDDVLDRRRADAPRLTGQYAASLTMSVDGLRASIGSPLPQAHAVERGADVGPRRGPHMGPVGTLAKAGADFRDAMPRHLR